MLADNHKTKILIVDDERANRLMLVTMLRSEGYNVVEAANGREGVEKYKSESPDIVLMDISMPVMNGYEATRIIKSLAGDEILPVIFLTSVSNEQALVSCIESGGDDFLAKPVHFTILCAKVKAALRTRSLYHSLQREKDTIRLIHEQLQFEHAAAEKLFKSLIDHIGVHTPNSKSYLSPAALSSGDFILSYKRSEDRYIYLIGDFTGHGLAAALGTLPTSQFFSELVKQQLSVCDIANQLNNRLCTILPKGMFCAAALIEFDYRAAKVEILNMGLPDIYLLLDQQIVHKFSSVFLMMGIMPTRVENYQAEIMNMRSGAALYAYTDGLVEAENFSGEFFGNERLEEILTIFPLQERFQQIIDAVSSFKQGILQSDDITLLELCCAELDSSGGISTQHQ